MTGDSHMGEDARRADQEAGYRRALMASLRSGLASMEGRAGEMAGALRMAAARSALHVELDVGNRVMTLPWTRLEELERGPESDLWLEAMEMAEKAWGWSGRKNAPARLDAARARMALAWTPPEPPPLSEIELEARARAAGRFAELDAEFGPAREGQEAGGGPVGRAAMRWLALRAHGLAGESRPQDARDGAEWGMQSAWEGARAMLASAKTGFETPEKPLDEALPGSRLFGAYEWLVSDGADYDYAMAISADPLAIARWLGAEMPSGSGRARLSSPDRGMFERQAPMEDALEWAAAARARVEAEQLRLSLAVGPEPRRKGPLAL